MARIQSVCPIKDVRGNALRISQTRAIILNDFFKKKKIEKKENKIKEPL